MKKTYNLHITNIEIGLADCTNNLSTIPIQQRKKHETYTHKLRICL